MAVGILKSGINTNLSSSCSSSSPPPTRRSSASIDAIGMNGTALRVFRLISLLISALLCCAAVTLLTIGVATPSWLYVYYRVAQGIIEEHRHGLWLDCVLRGGQGGGSNPYAQSPYQSWGDTNGNDLCEYKWVNMDPYGYSGGGGGPGGGVNIDPYLANSGSYSAMNNMYQTDYAQHRFLAWHVSTLVCLIIAITAGVFAIFACLCTLFTSLCSSVAALLEFVAFISSAIGVSIFFINANRPEIRYTQIPNAGVFFAQQMRGFSFDLALASVFIFMLSCLLGVLGSVMGFMRVAQRHENHRRHRHRRMDSKTFPKTEISTVSSSANDSHHHQHHDHNNHAAHLNMATATSNQPHLIRIRNDGTGSPAIRDNSIGV